MNRRQVLSVLGLGAIGAAGGGAYIVTSDPERNKADQPDSLKRESPKEVIQSMDPDGLTITELQLSFDYQPISENLDDSGEISAIEAQPASDQKGDRISVKPGEALDIPTLASFLRAAWNVGDETEITGAVDGEEITFRGGTVSSYGILVAQHNSKSSVYTARGESLSVAEQLARSWSL